MGTLRDEHAIWGPAGHMQHRMTPHVPQNCSKSVMCEKEEFNMMMYGVQEENGLEAPCYLRSPRPRGPRVAYFLLDISESTRVDHDNHHRYVLQEIRRSTAPSPMPACVQDLSQLLRPLGLTRLTAKGIVVAIPFL